MAKHKAAVLGWPVKHSLSPRLHQYWMNEYAIDGSYEAIETAPDALKEILEQLEADGYVGVNLTLPHKETALHLVDELDDIAEQTGAVNTIKFKEGIRLGMNTDSYGFTESLRAQGILLDGNAVVLGAGGAARAVCAGLLQSGMTVTLLNRTRGKALAIADALGRDVAVGVWSHAKDVLPMCSLLVNTTSLGMQGQPPLDIALDDLPANAVVTDIVYKPLITPLLANAQTKGNKTVDGLGMLLYQAQAAFEAWFGVKPEVTDRLRNYMVEAL